MRLLLVCLVGLSAGVFAGYALISPVSFTIAWTPPYPAIQSGPGIIQTVLPPDQLEIAAGGKSYVIRLHIDAQTKISRVTNRLKTPGANPILIEEGEPTPIHFDDLSPGDKVFFSFTATPQFLRARGITDFVEETVQ